MLQGPAILSGWVVRKNSRLLLCQIDQEGAESSVSAHAVFRIEAAAHAPLLPNLLDIAKLDCVRVGKIMRHDLFSLPLSARAG